MTLQPHSFSLYIPFLLSLSLPFPPPCFLSPRLTLSPSLSLSLCLSSSSSSSSLDPCEQSQHLLPCMNFLSTRPTSKSLCFHERLLFSAQYVCSAPQILTHFLYASWGQLFVSLYNAMPACVCAFGVKCINE